jgi:replicative DNA helicase
MSLDDIIGERGLPSSLEAEKSILGGILLDPAALDATGELAAPDFYLDSNQRIFARIAELRDNGIPIDIVTVAEHLNSRHELEAIGGASYLAFLIEGLPRHLSIDAYVRIVRDKAQLRRIITECSLTARKAIEQELAPDELLAEHDKRLFDISSGDSHAVTLATISARQLPILDEERNSRKPLHVVGTGFSDLDWRLSGGWRMGELSVLAGRGGEGKSALATQTLIECGWRGIPALCFQLEMDEQQVYRRMLSAVTGIHYERFTTPYKLTDSDRRLVADAHDAILRWPIRIEFSRSLNAGQLVARARRAIRREGCKFVALDYLQKLQFAGVKTELRHIAVGDAARALASLARDEHIAVLALSSLTEKSGKAANARPSMTDLKASGDIAYEAANIVLLHREETCSGNPEIEFTGRIIIDKQRQGRKSDFAVNYSHALQFESTERKTKTQQTRMFEQGIQP